MRRDSIRTTAHLLTALVVWLAWTGPAAAQVGLVLADRPTEPNYAPDPGRSFNSGGGAIRVERDDVGRYRVTFERLGYSGPEESGGETGNEDGGQEDGGGPVLSTEPLTDVNPGVIDRTIEPIDPPIDIEIPLTMPESIVSGGHAQVSAVGTGNAMCKLEDWEASGFDVTVACFGPNGAPTDSAFAVLAGWPGGARPEGPIANQLLSAEGNIFAAWTQINELQQQVNSIQDRLDELAQNDE